MSLGGWSLKENSSLANQIEVLYEWGPTSLALVCRGVDFRLSFTDIMDLRPSVGKWGIHPCFVYDGERDPMVVGAVRAGTDILVHVDDLDRLDEAVALLNPTFGAADRLTRPTTVSGWAKLSPTGKVTIKAWFEGQVIAEAVADLARTDMKNIGDGRFGFSLDIPLGLSSEEIINQVLLKAYYRGAFLRLVPYWNKIVIV